MDKYFDACLKFTLGQEGGFSDNRSDPGGATFRGITLATLRDVAGFEDATVARLRALDPLTIGTIYRRNYWDLMRCGLLPGGVDLMVFDHGVNAGPGRAVPMLQRQVDVDDDGIIGPMTLAAVTALRPGPLLLSLRKEQEAYYRGLKGFTVFGNGWLTRLSRRYVRAATLAADAANLK